MAWYKPARRQQHSLRSLRKETACWRLRAMAVGLIVLCLCWQSLLVAGQTEPRDFAISTPLVSYAADGTVAVVSFTITNQGGDAQEESQVTIADNDTGRVEMSEKLPILLADQTYPFSAELPLADYPEKDIFLKVEVGIDQYELAGSPIARNNGQLFRINVADARAAIAGLQDSPALTDTRIPYDMVIPFFDIGIDFVSDGIKVNDSIYSMAQILLALVLLALVLFLLWILNLILRLVFHRPPTFDTWQAPYSFNSYHDPDSAQGRRQSWQFHAKNSAILEQCLPDQVAAIKHLQDAQGRLLGSWSIKAIRTVQYDMYGHVNRSAVFMPQRVIKQLNKLARRAGEMDNQQLNKSLLPIAGTISKAAVGAIERQNRALPIALDMRFDGVQIEVRIVFELYQCRNNAWHLLDQWEPEILFSGSRIPENFSYTLNGMLPGETFREFKSRLAQELAHLLGGLFYHHQAAAEPEAAPTLDENPTARASDMI